ncbi:MalY/PatB family protein [Schumannella soli]|uniref:cysteine-S-conjugate beta-lyase n=1 Tax=Schumannella soli TaxID=2590779 RepID=A0A506Y1I4_9MICO|nr:aminotransferase class I/II-fold pyridoxal phosphate-dependent enzyme [Schumannella soli]TPW74808.1 aminotransferase class I/II-fold pyridoxal phosphate-dependent enzyme [Schumannella soli]
MSGLSRRTRPASPFDSIPRDRLVTPTSRKWSLHPDTIGAWVAEMDFGTAPAVTAALHDAIEAGVLGYLSPSSAHEMAAATSDYLADSSGWRVDAHRIHHVSDVMTALGVVIRDFSAPGSAVIVPTPAYMPFLTYPPTLGREVIQVDGVVRDGRWQHDLEAIDAAFAAGAGTLVLCNPHNPTGVVLSRDELLAISEVVERHGGRVFADEIHAPLIYPGQQHIPYASISDAAARHTITGTSASKAWNIPGLKTAQLITSNDEDEAAYQRFGFAVMHGAATPGVIATTAAYRDGRAWLGEVVDYLDGNRRLLAELLAEHLPEVGYRVPDATYIAWLDLRDLGLPLPLADFLRDEAGVTLTDGALCGRDFAGWARLVFAMPAPILEQAVIAIADAVRRHQRTSRPAASASGPTRIPTQETR